ncbi:XdhC family protein [Litchfieldia salsa]|uniref:Xanthine dehydrogenase accessory factor n=1 Tax=Litchfieldia salsa TaxID=930152 RepID=A0A1H0TCE4_9BACI|nr:XdhC/CoxI family protein [Litchfieldia salsa]SDP51687.1 xanthine dehydrogenase accessory factor [Litchfieldia salsa]
MNYLFSVLDQIATTDSSYLATIVKVEGSSYQKEGTCMVFNKDGSSTGLLSGGCLETDLYERIKMQHPAFISFSSNYDMRSEDDVSWGQGVGCNGSIRVVVERLDETLKLNFSRAVYKLNNGKKVRLIKKLDLDFSVIDYLFICDDGDAFGSSSKLMAELNSCYERTSFTYNPSTHFYYFNQFFLPKPNLYIFGAGADVIPLVNLSTSSGFNVTVCDWRSAYCNREYFPSANKLIIGNPINIVQETSPSRNDLVVLMTHHYQKDKELIEILLNRELGYLGILGSLARSERLLENYQIPTWVHYPIGIPIKAKDPYEISISILAELINVKNEILNKEMTNV